MIERYPKLGTIGGKDEWLTPPHVTTGCYSTSKIAASNEYDSKESVAIGVGYANTASTPDGSWIVLAERNDDFEIINIKSKKVGGKIKPNTPYRLEIGKFVEAKGE